MVLILSCNLQFFSPKHNLAGQLQLLKGVRSSKEGGKMWTYPPPSIGHLRIPPIPPFPSGLWLCDF